eukprot:TRINITY_DN8223_c0_g1_i1.p1 TRINITY_DN8223_c0_g1~~TRINITY_DN8223_c0_g1_i1.p1  ORF type:complete len:170 (-),score=27.71 TRINITY_DN8223_c0_g1_i1:149-658(-)
MLSRFVFVAILSAADCSEVTGGALKLTWKDCGDSSTHTKITSVAPSTVQLGSTTTITGTGTLDTDVSSGTFEATVTGPFGIHLLDCKGDAGAKKTCNLPLGTGSITYDGMTLPVKAGTQSISMEIQLASSLPSSLATTKTVITATNGGGDKLICLEVDLATASQGTLIV